MQRLIKKHRKKESATNEKHQKRKTMKTFVKHCWMMCWNMRLKQWHTMNALGQNKHDNGTQGKALNGPS
jgi:hypothetical protein